MLTLLPMESGCCIVDDNIPLDIYRLISATHPDAARRLVRRIFASPTCGFPFSLTGDGDALLAWTAARWLPMAPDPPPASPLAFGQ